MRTILTVCILALAALASACVAPGYGSGTYGPAHGPGAYAPPQRVYAPGRPYHPYRSRRPVAYVEPAVVDQSNYLCTVHRHCPQVLYYSDNDPATQKRLAKLEAKVELQGKQILALAENDKELEEGLRLVVALMRKNRQTLDQVVEQNKLACERFMKKPEVIKDQELRAKQEKFCKALDKAAADQGVAAPADGGKTSGKPELAPLE